MYRRISAMSSLVGAIVLISSAAPLGATSPALAASVLKPHFRALHWRVGVPDATGYVQNHQVKPGGRYTLCSMDQLSELSIFYSYRSTLTHGLPYTMTISGPGGSEKARFHTARTKGTGYSGWSAGALPPLGTLPAEPGKYTVTVLQHAKTLMRASIVLTTSNTCS
jgi:hypothetical protein